MKLTAQEEYGLRCLLQVARRAPADGATVSSIRDVADAEGLSSDYAAKRYSSREVVAIIRRPAPEA